MQEKIKVIADHYGYEPQSRQLIEEMAELTQAINKLWRKKGNVQNTDKTTDECLHNVFEEIADVEIMLEQVKHLLNCHDEVNFIKRQKINRTLQRMKPTTIKCNSVFACGSCIVEMGLGNALNFGVECDIASECGFDREVILKRCEHAVKE